MIAEWATVRAHVAGARCVSAQTGYRRIQSHISVSYGIKNSDSKPKLHYRGAPVVQSSGASLSRPGYNTVCGVGPGSGLVLGGSIRSVVVVCGD